MRSNARGIKVERLRQKNKEKKWLLTTVLISEEEWIIQGKDHGQDMTWRPSNYERRVIQSSGS